MNCPLCYAAPPRYSGRAGNGSDAIASPAKRAIAGGDTRVDTTGIGKRLMKGSAWISASALVVNGLTAISTVVLAANLAVEDFGLVAIGTTIVAIVGAFTEVSLAKALVQHADPTDGHYDTAFTLNVLRGTALFVMFAASAIPVARFYGDNRLIAVMVALGGSVFMTGFANPRRALLQRQMVFWQEFTLLVTQRLAGVAAAVTIAILFRSYWALVAGTMVTAAVGVAVSYTTVPYRPRLSLRHTRDLMSFSIWLTAGQIVNTLNWRSDQLLVGRFLGTEPLGLYTVGNNLAVLPTREVTAPLTTTIFPAFSAIAGDRPRLAAAYQRSQALVTAIALPAGFGAALVAEPLVLLTMGERWLPAVFVIQILAAVFALQTLGSLAQPLGLALGQPRVLFVRDTQMLMLRLPLILAAMLMFGLYGLVLARVASGLMATVLNLLLVRRFIALPVAVQLCANIRALAATAVMVAGTAAVHPLLPRGTGTMARIGEIAALATVGALLYVGTSLVLWMAQGRPAAGPEAECQRLVRRLTRGRRTGHGDRVA